MGISVEEIKKHVIDDKLDLTRMKLTDDDIPVICDYLIKNTAIKFLNVRENKIGEKGAKLLADNKTLTSLNMRYNDIGEKGAEYLAGNKTLTSLDVAQNSIGDKGAEHLATNKTLISLYVAENYINDKGAEHLATNKTLLSLDITGNGMSDKWREILEQNLKKNREEIKKETDCLKLIQEKLLPLSKDYLHHLEKEHNDKQEYFNAHPEYMDTARKIWDKIEIVRGLVKYLSDLKNTPRPSERLKNFYTELNDTAIELKAHRDPAWQRYIRTAVILAGILFTAIVPGLAALAIYSNTGAKESKARKSTYFWRSQGENLVNELMKDKPDEALENKLDNTSKKK